MLCCRHLTKYPLYVGFGSYLGSYEVGESQVELWWPNEYGEQTLYLLTLELPNSRRLTQVAFR